MFCSTTDDGIEKQEDYGRSFCLFGDDSDSSGELEEEEGEMIGMQINGVP